MIRTIKSLFPVPLKNAVKRLLNPPVALPSESAIQTTWSQWFSHFNDNPFGVEVEKIDRQEYLDLAQKAADQTYPDFMHKIEQIYGYSADKAWLDQLALSTQVVKKSSSLLYVHGHLLYGAVRNYAEKHSDIDSISILEVGTARGFSAICMAKALHDANRSGRILTVDVLPANKPIYWNCIHDADGPRTRLELLKAWQSLVEGYITFIQGYSSLILEQLVIPRIHVAFLDGEHTYNALSRELSYVRNFQQSGDLIICDDYTQHQFPGVVQAVDDFVSSNPYSSTLFTTSESRGYVVLARD